jgi:hypothetical protein
MVLRGHFCFAAGLGEPGEAWGKRQREDRSGRTATLGSGNATQPAFLSGSNVELFATLTGKRSRVGSVEEILGEKGFGRLTRPFVPDEFAAAGLVQRAAEARLDAARHELCRSSLKLRCEREPSGDDGQVLWRVWLTPPAALALTGIGAVRVWPITRGEGHARDALGGLWLGQPIDLGAMPLLDLTRFLACHVSDRDSEFSILFSTGFILGRGDDLRIWDSQALANRIQG